jgi:hypothetical protein
MGKVVCAIHQPNLFPRLSTVAKIYRSDIWVVLDNVQFNSRDYQHRARLAMLDNPATQQWLSIAVQKPQGSASIINELLLLAPQKSARHVDQMARQYFRQSQHWPEVRKVTDDVCQMLVSHPNLSEATEVSMRALLQALGWKGRVVRSSSLTARTDRVHRLADLTAAVGATEYLCGTGGASYLHEEPFEKLGIKVRYAQPPRHTANTRRLSALWDVASRGTLSLYEELTS